MLQPRHQMRLGLHRRECVDTSVLSLHLPRPRHRYRDLRCRVDANLLHRFRHPSGTGEDDPKSRAGPGFRAPHGVSEPFRSPRFFVVPSGRAERGKITDMNEVKDPFGGSSHSSASPDEVWAVWTNPAEWPGDVIVMAAIDGPFAVGAKITMRVKRHPPLRLIVTRVEAQRLWTAEARAPGVTETIHHLIESTESGTLITQRSVFTGPLASIAGRLLGRTLRKTFEATTAHFGRLAEGRATS